jgi:probable HAF family extracellular repeat protein
MTRIVLASSTAAVLLVGTSGCGAESPSPTTSAAPPAALSSIPHSTARGIQDLGTFGWDHGFGFEINDHGEIAGRTDMGPPNAPTAAHAVFWSPRTGAIDLGTLGGALSETRALNEHGLVVGLAQKPGEPFNQRHPTVWKVRPGGVETLELGPVAQGQAEDVNNRGVVVGWTAASVTGPQTGFRWTERGGMAAIPPLAGPRSAAAGINEAGDVVGSSTVSPLSPFVDHAVVWWRGGSVTDIGTLGFNTTARSINERGEVVGFGQSCPGCPQHAFYWSEETGIVDLGLFGGTRSFAFEIDNHGRIAGWYETGASPPFIRHAFIWTLEGGKVDLPTLGGLDSSTGSINGRGQVTGRAQNAAGAVHAVIWQLGPDRP